MGKRSSVIDVCTARLGVHRGALAAANAAQWAIAAHELGHVPSTAEYSRYWNVTERTGWNHRARIHAALGDDWQDVVVSIAKRIGESRSPRAVMQLPVPA